MSKILLAGGQNIGVAILRFLREQNYSVVGIIARSDDTGQDGVFPSLKRLTMMLECDDIPVIFPDDVNAPQVLEFIEASGADVLISAMYNRIFKKDIIDYFEPKLGIINIHYAPLPRYCGFWPEMWAIWNQEKNFGITYHYVDRGIDTGKILYQRKIDITADETRPSLYHKCDRAALEIFKEHYDKFLNARQPTISQNTENKTYFKRELPNGGFIDLTWDREKIERFVRATSFYPFIGAKLRIGDRVYSIVDKDLEFFKPHFIGEKAECD